MIGRVDTARERVRRAIAAASDNESPYEMAFAKYMDSYLELWIGDLNAGEAAAARTLALSEEHGFSQWGPMSRIALGSARARLGNVAEGIELITQGMSALVEIGSDVKIRDYHGLAEAHALNGAISDALETIERALRVNPEEIFLRPDTLRLRGEMRLKIGQSELAEADFREAIALAQKISAKMLELRATVSLARLMRDTNRRDEARAMLAPLYAWFTEGFDARDLKDAKALLDELSV